MLGGRWKYEYGRSKSGDLEKGYPEGWDWSKDGGNYNEARDFFSVHWEVVRVPKYALSIRLHVESPRYVDDAFLNDLKREVIAAMLASDIRQVVQQKDYTYRVGIKTSLAQARQNKSTEAFRVVLTDEQPKPTHKEDIEAVHAAVGSSVDKVLERFADRLNQHFRS